MRCKLVISLVKNFKCIVFSFHRKHELMVVKMSTFQTMLLARARLLSAVAMCGVHCAHQCGSDSTSVT